ncbi:MAG: ribulose-phosphate 3-epimerase [Candidatus Eisenbacteria bacterium]
MPAKSVLIAPSILSADFTKLGDELRAVEDAGADMIHVDVMDGHFVPNLTMGPFIVEAVKRATDLPVDAHLMVTNPEALADAFVDAGADYVVFHVEACDDVTGLIGRIHGRGAKAGLAVNPPNPCDLLEPYLDMIDMALVMTVNPGYAGQSFMADVMPKLSTLRGLKVERGLDFLIEVDGGIASDTVETVVANGGEVLVASSAIFRAGDIREALRGLRSAAAAAL